MAKGTAILTKTSEKGGKKGNMKKEFKSLKTREERHLLPLGRKKEKRGKGGGVAKNSPASGEREKKKRGEGETLAGSFSLLSVALEGKKERDSFPIPSHSKYGRERKGRGREENLLSRFSVKRKKWKKKKKKGGKKKKKGSPFPSEKTKRFAYYGGEEGGGKQTNQEVLVRSGKAPGGGKRKKKGAEGGGTGRVLYHPLPINEGRKKGKKGKITPPLGGRKGTKKEMSPLLIGFGVGKKKKKKKKKKSGLDHRAFSFHFRRGGGGGGGEKKSSFRILES